jgi:hypothetical protein
MVNNNTQKTCVEKAVGGISTRLERRHLQGNHWLDLHSKEASASTQNATKLLNLHSCKTAVVHKIHDTVSETRCELVVSWAAC